MLYIIFPAILLFTGVVLVVAMYITQLSQKNIVLENTLPSELLHHTTVKKVLTTMLKRMSATVIITCVLSCLTSFIPFDSIQLFAFFFLLFGMLALIFWEHILAIGEVKEFKQKMLGVTEENEKRTVLIDTHVVSQKEKGVISPIWFCMPILSSIVSLVYLLQHTKMWSSIFTLSILIVLFLVILLYLYKTVRKLPVKAITYNTKINFILSSIRKKAWNKMILLLIGYSAVLIFITSIGLSTTDYQKNIFALVILLVATIFLIVSLFILLAKLRQQMNLHLQGVKIIEEANEDKYWRYGVYINKNDPRLFVPYRTNLQITINLGTKIGKGILIGIFGFIIVLITSLSLMLAYNDFTPQPFTIQKEKNALVLHHFLTTKKIPESKIESIELIDTKLKNVVKVAGTNSKHYNTGEFTVNGKSSFLLIHNNVRKMIEIKTPEKVYYLNYRTAEETNSVYQTITK
ncbi:PH domain-containing protein [Pilibacter termitis]|nr:PH domain-containing protein [Pilibacter termitis]